MAQKVDSLFEDVENIEKNKFSLIGINSEINIFGNSEKKCEKD